MEKGDFLIDDFRVDKIVVLGYIKRTEKNAIFRTYEITRIIKNNIEEKEDIFGIENFSEISTFDIYKVLDEYTIIEYKYIGRKYIESSIIMDVSEEDGNRYMNMMGIKRRIYNNININIREE